MLSGSFQQLLTDIVATLFLSGLYGYAVSLAANLLGDKGPTYDGRLTLNPFVHVDFIGTLALLLLGVGWIRPVKLEPEQFRRPRLGSVLVALFCLGAGVLVALLLLGLRTPIVLTGSRSLRLLVPVINHLFVTTLMCTALNLLPLPPLIGGRLLYALAPRLQAWAERYRRWTGLALGLALVWAHKAGLLASVRVWLIEFLR